MLAMYGMKNGSGPRVDSLVNASRFTNIMENANRRNIMESNARRAEFDLLAHRRRMNEIAAGFSGDIHRTQSLLSKRKFDSGPDSDGQEGESALKKAKSHFSLPHMKRTLKPIPPLLSYSKRDKTFTEVNPGTSSLIEKSRGDNKNSGHDLYSHTEKSDILKRTDEPPSGYVSKHLGHRSEETIYRQHGDEKMSFDRKITDGPSDHRGFSINPPQRKTGAKRIDYKSVSSLLNNVDKEDDDNASNSRETTPEKTEEKRSAFREVTKRGQPSESSTRVEHDDFGEFDGREKQLSPAAGPLYSYSSYKHVTLSQFSRRFSDPMNCGTERPSIATSRHLSPTSLSQVPILSNRRDICVETLGKSVSPLLLDVPSPTGSRAFRSGIHSDMLTAASKSAFSPPNQSAEHLRAGVIDYLQKSSPVPKAAFPQTNASPHYYDSIRTAFKNFSEMNSKSSRGLLPGVVANNTPEPNRYNSVPLPPPPTEVGALSSFSGYPRLYDGDIAASAIPYTVQKSPSSQAVMPLSSTVFNFAQNWCAKCNASFRMTSDLVYHMRTHHKRDIIDESKRKREEKLRCDICGETFRERHHLSRHMTSHNG